MHTALCISLLSFVQLTVMDRPTRKMLTVDGGANSYRIFDLRLRNIIIAA